MIKRIKRYSLLIALTLLVLSFFIKTDAALADELVAHWKFNESSGLTATDELGLSNGNLVNLSENAWVRGLDGNALDFGSNNTSGYVTIADNATIHVDSSQSFTYSVLLSSDFFKGGNTIVLSKGVWNDLGMYDIELTGTSVSFGVKGKTQATWYTTSFAGKFKPGNWVHLACVRDRAADSLRIYFNGESLGAMKDDADGTVDPAGAPLIIGAYESSRHYKGKMDDLRLYNYALSAEEVTTLKDSYPTDMTDGQIMAHWKMDSNAGWKVIDELGHSRGLVNNMPGNAWVPGLVGNALDFGPDNSKGFITIEDNDYIRADSSQSFTYSVLLSSDFFKGGNTIVLSKGVWNENGMYDIELTGTNVSFGVKGKTKATWYTASFAGKFKPGNWVHLVCVRDRAEDLLKIYFNGELLGSLKDDADGNVDPVGAPLIVGAYESSRHYRGKIDDLRLYNYALSAEEVTALKDSYPTDMTDGQIIAHWKMDSNAGWKVIDELDHSKGLLYNMPGNAWVPGLVGNAIDFTSGNDSSYIGIPDNDFINFDSTQGFTISALVKADPLTNQDEMHILFKGATTVDQAKGWEGKWYSLGFKSKEARFAVDDNVVKTQLGAKLDDSYPVNQWVHIVGVRDLAADSLKLYLNGNLIKAVADVTELNIASENLPLIIGNNHVLETHFIGQIDDVLMYNYAMTSEKVKELFDSYGIVTAIDENSANPLPVQYVLKQNYPNPFNPLTKIEFHLPQPGFTTLSVYNALGQEVATLVSEKLEIGVHSVTFEPTNLPSGVYFYKIKSGQFSQVHKMMFIK